jgi:hypothetical protein
MLVSRFLDRVIIGSLAWDAFALGLARAVAEDPILAEVVSTAVVIVADNTEVPAALRLPVPAEIDN